MYSSWRGIDFMFAVLLPISKDPAYMFVGDQLL